MLQNTHNLICDKTGIALFGKYRLNEEASGISGGFFCQHRGCMENYTSASFSHI